MVFSWTTKRLIRWMESFFITSNHMRDTNWFSRSSNCEGSSGNFLFIMLTIFQCLIDWLKPNVQVEWTNRWSCLVQVFEMVWLVLHLVGVEGAIDLASEELLDNQFQKWFSQWHLRFLLQFDVWVLWQSEFHMHLKFALNWRENLLNYVWFFKSPIHVLHLFLKHIVVNLYWKLT